MWRVVIEKCVTVVWLKQFSVAHRVAYVLLLKRVYKAFIINTDIVVGDKRKRTKHSSKLVVLFISNLVDAKYDLQHVKKTQQYINLIVLILNLK